MWNTVIDTVLRARLPATMVYRALLKLRPSLLGFQEVGRLLMGHADSVESGKASTQWIYTSTVEAEPTAKIIIRVAGILTLGSLLLGFFLPSNTSLGAHDAVWLSVATLIGILLIAWAPRAFHTKANVGPGEVLLSTTGFRVRLDPQSIESVTKSNFPSGGYGYRLLGKKHRGFISGGPQVDIRLTDGREYTVSVKSDDEFCSAVTASRGLK